MQLCLKLIVALQEAYKGNTVVYHLLCTYISSMKWLSSQNVLAVLLMSIYNNHSIL